MRLAFALGLALVGCGGSVPGIDGGTGGGLVAASGGTASTGGGAAGGTASAGGGMAGGTSSTGGGAAGGTASTGGGMAGGTSSTGGGTAGGTASTGGGTAGGVVAGGRAGGAAAGGGTAGGASSTGGGVAVFDGGFPLDVQFDEATPEQVAIHAPVIGPVPAMARVTVRYKASSESTWKTGHPLLRINPQWISSGAPRAPVDAFAGTIFDLTPGTAYDLELSLVAAGTPTQVWTGARSTRALPAASGIPTVMATPTDMLQQRFAALTPGTVLELAAGTYTVDGLNVNVAGTASQPITIRGASRTGVVLRDTGGAVLQLQRTSHLIIENLTLEGSGTDSGTNASSVGISFWNGAVQEFITIRNVDIRGVDQGIVASGRTRGVLIWNTSLRGNNVWTMPFIQTNLTWNDDGIRIPGEGNCAWENTLHAFGDAFAVTNGVHSAAVYFYRNRVTMTGDDGFEADYGTRNLGLYDTFFSNSATFLSLDPLWGGPLYAFRNVAINTIRGPFKWNDTNSGFLVYNNTIVRTEGTTTWGWVQFNNGALRNWAYRNNIIIYRGPGNLYANEAAGNTPLDFTHNAWFPDRSIWWTNTGGSFSSLAATRAGLPATVPVFSTSTRRHEFDVITTADPFSAPVMLGAGHLTEVMPSAPPSLAAGSTPKNAGVEIPNITDGFSGTAPDMGGVISGRSAPTIGATRP